MSLRLISHVNGDGDLLPAWFSHYARLGVTSFHLIVHGPPEDNRELFHVSRSYPTVIEATYEGTFAVEEKQRRINALLRTLAGGWVVLVDSDEFLELPFRDLNATVRRMHRAGATALSAPMVQRLTADGSLASPDVIPDPDRQFPLCSVDLCRHMGVDGGFSKYPLFFCAEGTQIQEGGNHQPPDGTIPLRSSLQGVTHHFKWRQTVLRRLSSRAASAHTWRHESARYLAYLADHGSRLPMLGAFAYSRRELFRRRLLRKGGLAECAAEVREVNRWREQVRLAARELTHIVDSGNPVILVDEEQLGDALVPRHRVPFPERGGQYGGPPAHDDDGIRELERQRQAGAGFIVFAWPAFWWLEHYAGLHRHLRANFPCLLDNDRLVVFALRA